MIQITLKIDEQEEPVLAEWIKRFQGKRSRLLSLNIRKAIRFYIKNGTGTDAGTGPGAVD